MTYDGVLPASATEPGHPGSKELYMTIPDIGHCAGSGGQPIDGTVQDDEAHGASGVCAACSGRFELRDDGALSLHAPAEIDDREAVVPDDPV